MGKKRRKKKVGGGARRQDDESEKSTGLFLAREAPQARFEKPSVKSSRPLSRLRIKGDKKRNGARVQFSSRAKSRPSSSYKGRERAPGERKRGR